ncbi:hypothetical protein cypCar_00041880 [Cyprinus carpio]|nr:hypothetical protein cypCar_00041880 [Cyprinus carpio]
MFVSTPCPVSVAGRSQVLQKHGYTIKEELGRGVFLVDKGEANHFVVKQMNSRARNELDTVKKEIKILKEMIHGYIVSYVDSFEVYHPFDRFLTGLFRFDSGPAVYSNKNNVLHRDIQITRMFSELKMYINLGDFGIASKMLGKQMQKIMIVATINRDPAAAEISTMYNKGRP